ncbi:MAG: outer membrane protein assembly factor [Gammaproteobacteria bacterium]|nr:outer membrane protein assembly factor [Gammaproteobacteria bacterium]
MLHLQQQSFATRLAAGILLFLLSSTVWADKVTISVEGITDEPRDNVLASLTLHQERERELSVARIRRLHEQAVSEITTALQPFGYYRARVESSLEHDENGWIARYRIEPGRPIPVKTVDVQIDGDGRTDPEFEIIIDNFPLQLNEPLNQRDYDDTKHELQTVAAERGYFDMRFTRSEMRIDLADYHADIYLHIDTGGRYRFGEINVEQQILNPELLQRYIRIQPGDYYSAEALLELQQALLSSEYFSDVEMNADPLLAKDHSIPVTVHLTARRPDKYTFGLGYGTDTDARVQAGWERRYLNADGHHVRADVHNSGIERSITTGYFIPIRNPRTDQLGFTAGYSENTTRTADTEIRQLAVNRTNARGHVLETLSLTYHNEKFEIGDETGASTLLMPGINWTYFWGDERVFTRRGARATLDLRGASSHFVSDISLLQSRLGAKIIRPVGDSSRFIVRGDVGHTRLAATHELPASLRFFSGGDVSVRGYAYNSRGPTDDNGNVVGGRNLLVGSVEYEQHITGKWAAAVFYDVGNAVNNFSDPLDKGAGIGVRWRSPIGQIRVDVASAISEPDKPLRLHIYLGPDL